MLDLGMSDFATTAGRHVFDTALGFMGIAWSARGVRRFMLPGHDRETTDRRLAAMAPAYPATDDLPPAIAALVADVRRYAAGETVRFENVQLDLDGVDDFRLAIYGEARKLGFGETTTYGELASRAGHAGLARETGAAMGSNPIPLIVPCHRVLAAGNRIGGFSAPGGSRSKERMLALEGASVGPPPSPQQAFAF